MRCSCCDWSPDTRSSYFDGLSLSKTPRRLTDFHGDLVCDVCRESVYDDDGDLFDPEEHQEDE